MLFIDTFNNVLLPVFTAVGGMFGNGVAVASAATTPTCSTAPVSTPSTQQVGAVYCVSKFHLVRKL